MRRKRLLAAVAAAVFTLIPTTAAASPALVAPGAPFRTFPSDPPTTRELPTGEHIKIPPTASAMDCSQGPAGTVRGTRVMLTASHCVNTLPGFPEISGEFSVPVGQGYTRIGTREKANHVPLEAMLIFNPLAAARTADWGIVHIDDTVTDTNLSHSRDAAGRTRGNPVKLTGIRDFRTLRPGEVSVDNFGQPICKDGATTGRTCATQIGRSRNAVYSWNLGYKPGDSGGVNFDPRDGAVIGISSMGIGPVGKAQPADRIIEDAYGVPDGQVNEVFKVTESSAPRAEFTPSGVEEQRVDDEIRRLNPGYAPLEPRAEFRKAVGAAQRDARHLADKAVRGQFNRTEVEHAVDHHTEELTFWGSGVIAENINEALGR